MVNQLPLSCIEVIVFCPNPKPACLRFEGYVLLEGGFAHKRHDQTTKHHKQYSIINQYIHRKYTRMARKQKASRNGRGRKDNQQTSIDCTADNVWNSTDGVVVFLNESSLYEQDEFGASEDSIPLADPSRKLTIYSWGRRIHANPQCDVTFDLVHFRSEYEKRDICKSDGTDLTIQECMRSHRYYGELMNVVIRTIEMHQPSTVSFACSWGKHRSMAFAELLKSEYYPKARLRHSRLLVPQPSDRTSKRNRKNQRTVKEKKMAILHDGFA